MIEFADGSTRIGNLFVKEKLLIYAVVFAILGLGIMAVPLYLFISVLLMGYLDFVFFLFAGLSVCLGALPLKISRNSLKRAYMQFDVTTEGLVLIYPSAQAKVIPWYEFEDLCICYANFSRGHSTNIPRAANKVIVCALPDAKLNMYGQWNVISPMQYDRIIAFDYTQALHDEFIAKCRRELIDRRSEQAYKLK